MPSKPARRVLSSALVLGLVRAASAPAQGAPTDPAPVAASPPPLDPSSPLDAMPDLGVDWPVLDAVPPAPDAAPGKEEALADDAEVDRYTVVLEGIDDLDPALRTRFDALSALRTEAKHDIEIGQLDRRARADAALLTSLQVALGYYDATTDYRVAGGATPRVTLSATPGRLYRIAAVSLTGLGDAPDGATLARAFTVTANDPVNADRVTAAVAALRAELGRRGYPYAKVPDPDVVIDREAATATVALAVDLGGEKRFGQVVVRGAQMFSASHIELIARFHPGDRYNAARLEDLRRALVATGLVSSVRISTVQAQDPDRVDVIVDLTRAPPRTIALEAGYGTGEGVRAEASWQHRNLLPPEGAVTFRGVAGTREQLVGALLRRSNFRQRDQVLTAQVTASHSNLDAYDARSFLLAAGIERQTNIIWQKKWTWSYGAELLASDERSLSTASGITTRRTYFVAAVPVRLAYDGSDDLLDPTTGYRLAARVSPEASLQSGAFGYVRAQIDASAYQPLGRTIVAAGRLRFGAIGGATSDRIAPSRRFYSGGGGSVRGYGYQAIGPRDADNDPIGGRSLTEFAVEARIRFGDFGVVPFLDGGNLYRSALPSFGGLRYGAGMGVRYYTSFGPIRLDVGTPLNRRSGDSRVSIYVSLGQAF